MLYGINYSPELTGIGKYSGEMGAWLSSAGNRLQVITALPYYPDWKISPEYNPLRYVTEVQENVRIKRCPLYVPKEPSAVKRVLHLLSFSITSFFALAGEFRRKPDVVILVVPTLFCALPALVFAKFTKAKKIIHIQDYEVDAFFGLSANKNSKISSLFRRIEKFLLMKFDRISTISEGMIRRAISKGISEEKIIFFPNWTETKLFKNVEKDDGFILSLGIDPCKKIILYSGNIGDKQGLEIVVSVAKVYQAKGRLDTVFVIVGEGAGKKRLVDQVYDLKLKNVFFYPLQPKEVLPVLLASADCHLVVQKRDVADAVLPSKLTNILAVGGNAVITADPDTTMGLLCEKFPGIACIVEPESVDDLVRGIDECLGLSRKNNVALEYAEEYLEKDVIMNKFLGQLNCLVNTSD